MTTRLEALRGGAKLATKEDKDRAKKAFDDARIAWRKRKRMCKDILDTLSEGMGKRIAELKEEFGLEFDEDAGVKLEDMEDDVKEPPLKRRRVGDK